MQVEKVEEVEYAPPVDAQIVSALLQSPSCNESLQHASTSLKRLQPEGTEAGPAGTNTTGLVQGSEEIASAEAQSPVGPRRGASRPRLGIGVSKVQRKVQLSKYTAEVNWNGVKVFLGTYDTLEKAQEIYDLFAFRKAGPGNVGKLSASKTNRSWSHYFVDAQSLHLKVENLTTTWEERYTAYDKLRAKCCTTILKYQGTQVEFFTINQKRPDYDQKLRPFPLYFNQSGVPRASLKLCGTTAAQLKFSDPRKFLFPELHLKSYTCTGCMTSFAGPECLERCGATDLLKTCRLPCGGIQLTLDERELSRQAATSCSGCKQPCGPGFTVNMDGMIPLCPTCSAYHGFIPRPKPRLASQQGVTWGDLEFKQSAPGRYDGPDVHWRVPESEALGLTRISDSDPRGMLPSNVDVDGRQCLFDKNSTYPDWKRFVVCHGRRPPYCYLHRDRSYRAQVAAGTYVPKVVQVPAPECVCTEPVPLSLKEVQSFRSWPYTRSFDKHGWRYWPGWQWNPSTDHIVSWD